MAIFQDANHRLKRLLCEPLEFRRMLAASVRGIDSDVVGPAATHSVDRYAILGEDVSRAESALEAMGIPKIKSFRHYSGLAVNLTDAEAEALSAVLDNDLRLISDAPYKAFDDGGVAGGGPGGGGGGPAPQVVPWGINAVNAPAAWSVTRGAGVAVCILDSGVDQDHPDLNISVGANYVDGGSWGDDNGHGTHVAGTVAALDNTIGVVGVAPEATLIAAKVANRQGQITNSDAADGIYGCAALRDSIDHNLPLVVNMSFNVGGADRFATVGQAIQDVEATGAIFVGSAGNWGSPCMAYPANMPEVYGVTAVNEDLSFADYSAYGWYPGSPTGSEGCAGDPGFMAPGTDVLSTYKRGGTKILTGTSMAAPHISGVLALTLSANSLGPVGIDSGLEPYKQGAGLIDAHFSVLNTSANIAPIATDDTCTTDEDVAVTVDVLSNDSDDDGDPVTIGSVTQGSHGSVVIDPDDRLTYTPNANSNGTDSFTYWAYDGTANSNWATVTVTINHVDDIPVAVVDADTTTENTPVTSHVVANDVLGDEPTTITAVTDGANGLVTFDGSAGATTYTPNAGFTGTDEFSYTITDDDGQTSTAMVTVTVNSQGSNNVIYVWDVDFESRQRGPHTDYRVIVSVRHDSDFDTVAEATDASMANAEVTVSFTDSLGVEQTLSGMTDSNGIFRSQWIKGLGSGDHRAAVVDLVLMGFLWDPDNELDSTFNDQDDDLDGMPDDILTI